MTASAAASASASVDARVSCRKRSGPLTWRTARYPPVSRPSTTAWISLVEATWIAARPCDGVRLLHEHRERVRVEPGERRDDQRAFVAGGPKFGRGGHRGRAHLVGLTRGGRGSAWQLVPQVPGDGLLRFPLAAFQTASLDVDGRRSAKRVRRSRSRDPSRVVEHDPGGLPVTARDCFIEHRCARRRARWPAARSQPRGKRTGGASRPAFGNCRTELAPECTPAQPSRERPGAGHERSLEADACTLDGCHAVDGFSRSAGSARTTSATRRCSRACCGSSIEPSTIRT